MMLNNVNLDALQNSLRTARSDVAKAKRLNRLEGTWNQEEGHPQFRAAVKFERGEVALGRTSLHFWEEEGPGRGP